MRRFFANLFGKEPAKEQGEINVKSHVVSAFKKGDLIIFGNYEIGGLLGRGGFGEVYLAYDRRDKSVCALKTIRADYLADATSRDAFRSETLVWVNLDQHPFVVTARSVEQFSGRLFVNMEYIAPDARGRVSLLDHLAQTRGPIDTGHALRWAIQFCYGMEHASQHGIKCHRDIKPANILITQDGTLKVTDFGMALAADSAWKGDSASLVSGTEGSPFGLSLLRAEGRRICGTPGYIAPELFMGKKADRRSDIYSFGLVLWQMAVGSSLPPFHLPREKNIERYLRGVFEQQIKGRVRGLSEPLQPIVERCLMPEPSTRYGSFEELRTELESILKRTGLVVRAPSTESKTAASCSQKGYAFHILGRQEEAIALCANALELDPLNVTAWNTKGLALDALGQHTQALACFARFLEIDPRDYVAWTNMAMALSNLGRHSEAIDAYMKALEIDSHRPTVWNNVGYASYQLNRNELAIACFAKALEIDPQNAVFWNNNGHSLYALGRYEQAIASLTKAVEFDPLNGSAWNKRGEALRALGREEEAIACFTKALESNTSNETAWRNKGEALKALGRHDEAVPCFERVTECQRKYMIPDADIPF